MATRKIMIEADALFDTRLGTLDIINPAAASRVVQNEDYWRRDHEDWTMLTGGLVTTEQFKEAYAKRDDKTLASSMATSIYLVLVKVLNDYQANVVDGMVDDDIQLVINQHPYKFELDEIEELTAILRMYLGTDLTVTFCDIPLAELTPKELTDRYAAAFIYNFFDWIKIHQMALLTQRSPDFNMVSPKLFETNPARLTPEGKQGQYTAFRLRWLEHMDFDTVDARFFSMVRK